MASLLTLLAERFAAAFTTRLTVGGCVASALLLIAAAVVSITYGRRTGFLGLTASLPRATRLRIWGTVWFAPALVEETLFRVLLLPHPTEGASGASVGVASAMALAIFIVAHPLRTWLRPTPKNAVFTDTRFLMLAALLGAACTAAYIATGSVGPPILLHGVLVGAWLTRMGGWQKVSPPTP